MFRRAPPFFDLMPAQHAIGELLKGNPIPLGISGESAKHLHDIIDRVMDQHFYKTDADGKRSFDFPGEGAPKIPAWQWSSITNALGRFETVFAEDMRENSTYYVTRHGIYWTPALVGSADDCFPRELLPHIPQKARDDWKAAGRCMAFNLLSASGFHVARAVEAMIEVYYQFFCGKAPGETLHGWHDYIQALDAVKKSGASPAPAAQTLAEMRQMKDDYRNPIVHPRIVLSEADARMLFNNGETLIIAMSQELCEANKKVQPNLSLVNVLAGP